MTVDGTYANNNYNYLQQTVTTETFTDTSTDNSFIGHDTYTQI